MWPFKQKAHKPKEEDVQQERVETLRQWRAIGESFYYLNLQFVVTRHWDWFYDGPSFACIVAEYADHHGVIHSRHFMWGEAQALMRNNP